MDERYIDPATDFISSWPSGGCHLSPVLLLALPRSRHPPVLAAASGAPICRDPPGFVLRQSGPPSAPGGTEIDGEIVGLSEVACGDRDTGLVDTVSLPCHHL